MKTPLILAIFITAAALPAQELKQGEIKRERQKFAQLVTTKGVTYKGVEVSQVTAVDLRIMHADGLATVPLSELPPDIQALFGYNARDADEEMKARQVQRIEDLAKAERDKVAAAELREKQQAESLAISAIEKKAFVAEVHVTEKTPQGCQCDVWHLEMQAVKGQYAASGAPMTRLIKTGQHTAFVYGLDAASGATLQTKLVPCKAGRTAYATNGTTAWRMERDYKLKLAEEAAKRRAGVKTKR